VRHSGGSVGWHRVRRSRCWIGQGGKKQQCAGLLAFLSNPRPLVQSQKSVSQSYDSWRRAGLESDSLATLNPAVTHTSDSLHVRGPILLTPCLLLIVAHARRLRSHNRTVYPRGSALEGLRLVACIRSNSQPAPSPATRRIGVGCGRGLLLIAEGAVTLDRRLETIIYL
jgi:hypothetical protein